MNPLPTTEADSGLWRERSVSGASPPSASKPEPLEWQPPMNLRLRLARAISVPALAGTAVFVIAVAIAIVLTLLQSSPPVAVTEAAASEAFQTDVQRGSGGDSTNGANAVASTVDATSSSATVYVHVVGEVAKPGVVEVAAGTRVSAAIEAAGGATDSAVLQAVNLARVVIDGEQIVVPNAENVNAALPVAPVAGDVGAVAGGSELGSGIVNINLADAAALETLPRIGPALAQRILEWRQTNGAFANVDQLLDVPGVGAKTLDGFRERVTV